MFGIDVSHHQDPSKIDWTIAKEHCTFLIARATYGDRKDKRFEEWDIKCKEHGITFGAYHFLRQSKDVNDQYAAFKAQLDRFVGTRDIVPVIDVEENERYDGKPDRDKLISMVDAFRARIHRDFGCEPIIYVNPSFAKFMKFPVDYAGCPLWLAHYSKNPFIPAPSDRDWETKNQSY